MTSRSPNHPVNIIGTFEALSISESETLGGSQYGNVVTKSFLPCIGIRGDDHADFELTLITNTAISNKLEEGASYSISGKLMAFNDGTSPILTYNQNSITLRSDKPADAHQRPKLMVIGLGHVVEREEVFSTDEPTGSRLEVVIAHNDWDSRARCHKRFLIKYIIAGTKNQVKTFSLYQAGRELQLTGQLVDFDVEKKMAIVLVESVSVTSGHLAAKTNSSLSSSSSTPTKGGRKLIKFNTKSGPSTHLPTVSSDKKSFAVAESSVPMSHKGKEKADIEPSESEVSISPKGKEKANIDSPDCQEENAGSSSPPIGESDEELNPEPRPKKRAAPRKDVLKNASKRMKKL